MSQEKYDFAHEDVGIHTTPAVIEPGHTFGTVTDKISSIVLRKRTPVVWWIGLAVSFMLVNVLMGTITYLVFTGIGIWGNNQPVGWSFDIINFVWWIGIGHAGTLISVACAGLFPLLHTGRPWLAYWLFPYPNTMGIEPQFRSPLMWDVFAVSTYATISALFWYTGLIPDLATLRDRARSKFGRVVYGMAALGWRGSARHWARYEMTYLLLAGVSTPLVLSVHTIVSFAFAIGIIPGWHATIFP